MTRLTRTTDLNLLPVFDALMRRESVTLAARDVGLTQASASNALDRLRKALNDRILERQGNRMVPTLRAKALWRAVSEALGQLSSALETLHDFEPATSGERFRVGLDDCAVSTLGAELATRLRELAPNATLEPLPATHPAGEDDLRRSEIDLFCGAIWQPAPGLGTHLLWIESFVGLAARTHGFDDRPDLEAVLAVPHVLVSIRGAASGNVDAGLAPLGRTRRVATTVPTLDAAARLVAGSDHLYFCGRRLTRGFPDIHGLVPFDPPFRIPGFQIKLLWNGRDSGSPALTRLPSQLIDLAGNDQVSPSIPTPE